MKVTTQTADLLVIDDIPWLIGLSLIAMILTFVGAGIAMLASGNWVGLVFAIAAPAFIGLALVIFARRTQLVINGREGWLEIRERSFVGFNKVRHSLGEVERAVVEQSEGSDSSDSFRVTLIIPEGQSAGRHPVTDVYTSGDGAERAARAINHWLGVHRAHS